MPWAGDLKQRLTLQSPANTVDPVTNEVVTEPYTDEAEVWGDLQPLTSRELVRVKQVQSDTTHRLVIRYRTDVQETWRVVWDDPRGTHTAEVTGVNEIERRKWLSLDLTETT